MQVLVVAVLCLVRLGGKDVSPIYLGSTDSTFLAYGGAVSTLGCIVYSVQFIVYIVEGEVLN